MLYTAGLIKRFQEQYKLAYGIEISEEEANFELHRLARLLEIVLPAIFTEERDVNEQ